MGGRLDLRMTRSRPASAAMFAITISAMVQVGEMS